jgi:hypothetical protein
MVCYNKNGELIERINGDTYESLKDNKGLTKTKGIFHYDCRDSKLKLNDDRKVSINLAGQKDVQMIVLIIRTVDVHENKDVKSDAYDRAQFRFIDDETNQTLDSALFKDIKLTVPTPDGEGDEEPVPAPEVDDDDENKGSTAQNVIIVGRVFCDNSKWKYEQYHYCYSEEKYPDVLEKLGQMEVESRTYFVDKENLIKEEVKAMKESREAAAQAAAAKAANKKSKKKSESKKGGKDKEDDLTEEKNIDDSMTQINTDFMPGFKSVLDNKNSSVFGPITIELSGDKWDYDKTMAMIHKQLKAELGELYDNCKHGFEFRINGRVRDISRRNILNYSRKVQNLQILPIVPPVIVIEKKEGEGEGYIEVMQDE